MDDAEPTAADREERTRRLEQATAEIVAVQPRLYGYILKRLADREQTAEVLQRTNAVICRKIAEFEPGTHFAAWAFAIARFQIMAWRKDRSRDRLVFSDAVAEALDSRADDEAAALDARIPPLRRCLERLREADRSLIQARYRDGQSVASLGERMQASADAVGMRLLRIRRRLRDCVQAQLALEPGITE